MKVLVVHAHHEPQSFSSALYRQAVHTLSELGHEVATSDLYAMPFDPVSDRRNFTSVHDPGYLKQAAGGAARLAPGPLDAAGRMKEH